MQKGVVSVQEIIEKNLSQVFKKPGYVVGCGRTDTGVNAKNYVAHFESTCKDLIENKEHWIYKFNTLLIYTN